MRDQENTWPNGVRRALAPQEHEQWNDRNYPGTRQLCDLCNEPTGRCEEDELVNEDGYVVCDVCWNGPNEL